MARYKKIFYEITVNGWQSPQTGQMAKKQRQECNSQLGKSFLVDSLTLSQIERESKRVVGLGIVTPNNQTKG
jgi:hypothetical protein